MPLASLRELGLHTTNGVLRNHNGGSHHRMGNFLVSILVLKSLTKFAVSKDVSTLLLLLIARCWCNVSDVPMHKYFGEVAQFCIRRRVETGVWCMFPLSKHAK